jgi:hypothetical protein
METTATTTTPQRLRIGERLKNSKFFKFLRDKVKPVAGDVLETIGDVTGIEILERAGEIISATNDTNLVEEFKSNYGKYAAEILEAEKSLYEAELADRLNARVRELEYTQALGRPDWLMSAVILTGLFLFVGVIAVLLFVAVPEPNQRLADLTTGAVISIGTSIFAYYVGSSRGSRTKQEVITKFLGNG